jgi:hypothetical protein
MPVVIEKVGDWEIFGLSWFVRSPAAHLLLGAAMQKVLPT